MNQLYDMRYQILHSERTMARSSTVQCEKIIPRVFCAVQVLTSLVVLIMFLVILPNAVEIEYSYCTVILSLFEGPG